MGPSSPGAAGLPLASAASRGSSSPLSARIPTGRPPRKQSSEKKAEGKSWTQQKQYRFPVMTLSAPITFSNAVPDMVSVSWVAPWD